MKETVLLFNMREEDRLLNLEMALFLLRIRLRRVILKEYAQPLGHLAGLEEIPASDTIYHGAELDGEMLIFAFMDDDRLQQALSALHELGLGDIPYKAVLTPTNQYWTPVECFEEIRREHEAMTSGKEG